MNDIPMVFPFIWNGIPSELYGMTIAFSDTDYNYVPSGSGVTLQTDRVNSSVETYILGEVQDQVLEFPVEIYGDSMDVFKQTEIKNWLYGTSGYRHLQICIDNYNTFYYNCKLIPSTDVVFGAPNGFKFTVVCDAPGAWEYPKIVTYQFPKHSYFDFLFNNVSGDIDYLRPIIEFKTTVNTYNFSLINNSDIDENGKPREFKFTDIGGGEVIEVNNKDKLISSSTGLFRLGKFNKKFFRFKPGVNEITAKGSCEYLKITYQNFRRLGGAIY